MNAVRSDPAALAQARGIFIGGYGRSGSSLLAAMLGEHPEVRTIPFETSFLTCDGGALDLVRAISSEYSPMRLDAITHRFLRLLLHDLASPRSYPFRQFDLEGVFGRQAYREAVARFITQLGIAAHKGDGLTIDSAVRIRGWNLPARAKLFALPDRIVRSRDQLYFAPRLSEEQALAAVNALVLDLFDGFAAAAGRSLWCEQTTSNQVHADFLLKACPGARFVHVIRDPAVVASIHLRQAWAPHDLPAVAAVIRSNHDRWMELRAQLSPDSWLQVRFEELTQEPATTMRDVCRFLGLDYSHRAAAFPLDTAHLRAEETGSLENDPAYRLLLGSVAADLGYGSVEPAHQLPDRAPLALW